MTSSSTVDRAHARRARRRRRTRAAVRERHGRRRACEHGCRARSLSARTPPEGARERANADARALSDGSSVRRRDRNENTMMVIVFSQYCVLVLVFINYFMFSVGEIVLVVKWNFVYMRVCAGCGHVARCRGVRHCAPPSPSPSRRRARERSNARGDFCSFAFRLASCVATVARCHPRRWWC